MAKARLAAKSGPLMATSIGVGEPKLMTSLTMSAGSKPKRNRDSRFDLVGAFSLVGKNSAEPLADPLGKLLPKNLF